MTELTTTRRDFLRQGAVAGIGAALRSSRRANVDVDRTGSGARDADAAATTGLQPADVTIRIAPVLVELAPHRIISTIGYNGSVPAPIIRLHEGRAVTIELINDTDTPELVHWHGQLVPSEIDGAAEEGTPPVPPHGTRRYTLTPRPAGTRWVHTHTFSGPDLHRGMYTGQFGIVYVEAANEPGHYDREVFLATHEWEPFFGAEEMNTAAMFRILNASATENIQLALAGHEFEIVALDGNPVPTPRKAHVLALGVAERIDALVTMNNPGVWILGTPHDDDRHDGMGIVVEYAGATGAPRWIAPRAAAWDYTSFGASYTAPAPDETIQMVFGKINGGPHDFNRWTVNGQQYDHSTPMEIHPGKRYRLAFQNLSDDPHPVHLHRHLFEVVRVNGRSTSGVMKDTIVVPGFGAVDVDFVADDPGATLFHCHQTLHMDYGFMRLFRYV